jgi:hypothetical protein
LKMSKKYKITISLDEYFIMDNLNLISNKANLSLNQLANSVTASNGYDLNKNVVDYETDWIEISDELSSPFYREHLNSSDSRTTAMEDEKKMSCLYANKCWLDLKFYPSPESMSKTCRPRLELIYLLIYSDELEYEQKSIDKIGTRLLTIDTKFLFNNKCKHKLTFDLLNNSNLILKNYKKEKLQPQQTFIKQINNDIIDSMKYNAVAEIINNSNLDDERDENTKNSLYYFRVSSFNNAICKRQSKLAILSLNEKAIKQISNTNSVNENCLVSRQSFCLYLNSGTGEVIFLSIYNNNYINII